MRVINLTSTYDRINTKSTQNYHKLDIVRGSQAATVRSQTSHSKVTISHRGTTGGSQKDHNRPQRSHKKDTDGPQPPQKQFVFG